MVDQEPRAAIYYTYYMYTELTFAFTIIEYKYFLN